MDNEALDRFIDAFRLSIQSSPELRGNGRDHHSAVDWETLISLGLLQLKPAVFVAPEEDCLPADEQTEAQTLRPYPSVRCYSLQNNSFSYQLCSCILASFVMSLLQSALSLKAEKAALSNVEAFRLFIFLAR
jgi:hypothetical protein